MSPKKIQGCLYTYTTHLCSIWSACSGGKDQIMSVPCLHYTDVAEILCVTAVLRGHVQLLVIKHCELVLRIIRNMHRTWLFELFTASQGQIKY